MEFFEFILILVLIITIGEVITKVGAPMVDKLGDLVREMVASRKDTGAGPVELEGEVVEELERRLARIEDRLDFIEQLKGPDRRRALDAGGLERGDRQGATDAGGVRAESGSGLPTAEETAGDA